MTNTTVTFRTNDLLKREATKVFEDLGLDEEPEELPFEFKKELLDL